MREETENGRDALLVLAEAAELVRRNVRTFVVCGLLGLVCGTLLLSRRDPLYRVEATMRLENESSSGVLGDLVELTATPKAVSEMEVLRSRSVAEKAARGESSNSGQLTTTVDSARLLPLSRFVGLGGDSEWEQRGEKPRLRATVDPDPGRNIQPVLIVDFLGADLVRISKRGPLYGLGLSGKDPLATRFVPGERIEYDGMGLYLQPAGDLTDERFYLNSLRFEEAVAKVTKNTRVSETGRNSNVIRLTYQDTDPERAAAIANALCRIYLQGSRSRNEQRASQTVNFITKQLEEQLEKLETAELEVVKLQQENPKSVDVGVMGESLIKQISSLQLEEVQLRMLLGGIREALEHLNKGNFDALSRLQSTFTDPVTANYVEQMILLTSEIDLLDRSDSSGYKSMVMARRMDILSKSDELELEIAELENVLHLLATGELGALGGRLQEDGVIDRDPLLEGYLESWSLLENRLLELETEFTKELPEIQTLTARIAGLEERLAQFLNTRLAGLKAQRREYVQLFEDYGKRVDAYPEEESSKISVAIDGLRQRTVTHLTHRLTGLYSRLSNLETEQSGIEGQLAQLPEEVRVLADPMRRREAHSEIVKFLLGRQKEAEITRASTMATADFIDVAIPSRTPRGPFGALFIVGGLVLGMGLGLALAFVRQSFDRGVYTSEDLERVTGLTLFGAIPDYSRGVFKVSGDRDDFLALRDDPEGPVAEAYRSLRSNLKFVLNTGQVGIELRTLAFTSCTQSEGKSVTNLDMALSFALSGHRVLLVDADMRRPSANRYLGLDITPGLSDVLKGQKSWRESVRPQIFPGVDVICAGRQPASPGDLLASDATGLFIEDVRDAYDIVVFDVPPVLAVADIDCLASKLDAVLMVTRSGRLSEKVVQEGVRRLRKVGANVVGCVLNAARRGRAETKYGYGYGYGYGSEFKEVA